MGLFLIGQTKTNKYGQTVFSFQQNTLFRSNIERFARKSYANKYSSRLPLRGTFRNFASIIFIYISALLWALLNFINIKYKNNPTGKSLNTWPKTVATNVTKFMYWVFVSNSHYILFLFDFLLWTTAVDNHY